MERTDTHARASDLLRAGVKPRYIAAQLGASLHYVRNVREELWDKDRVIADAPRPPDRTVPGM